MNQLPGDLQNTAEPQKNSSLLVGEANHGPPLSPSRSQEKGPRTITTWGTQTESETHQSILRTLHSPPPIAVGGAHFYPPWFNLFLSPDPLFSSAFTHLIVFNPFYFALDWHSILVWSPCCTRDLDLCPCRTLVETGAQI